MLSLAAGRANAQVENSSSVHPHPPPVAVARAARIADHHRRQARRSRVGVGETGHRIPSVDTDRRGGAGGADRSAHSFRRRGTLHRCADVRSARRERHSRAASAPRPATRWERKQRLVQLAHDRQARDRQLDPYHNHIDHALFEINPAGVRGDSFNGDDSWDPIWEGAVGVDSLGWTAEMRIPYSQLRFSRESVQTWGMQIMALRPIG